MGRNGPSHSVRLYLHVHHPAEVEAGPIHCSARNVSTGTSRCALCGPYVCVYFELRTLTAAAPRSSIALHGAFEPNGAQFYPSCIQIEVTGSGSALPTSGLVSFPGAYTEDT